MREGAIAAQLATRYLAPVARVNRDHCERMAAAFVQHRCEARQAGQLYAAWRAASRVARERILAEPELFLKTQRQPPAPLTTQAAALERDLELAVASLERARRRLAQAMPEMDGRQREQTQCQIETARRALDRMMQGMGKELEAEHVEPGATNRDSGTERAGGEPPRDRARAAGVAPERAQSPAFEPSMASWNVQVADPSLPGLP